MYEFTNKEIKKKFKETEYGKKTNKYLLGSIISIGIIIFVIPIIVGLIGRIIGISGKEAEDFLVSFVNILVGLFEISLMVAIYFDGKRDGAIEQFKISEKLEVKNKGKNNKKIFIVIFIIICIVSFIFGTAMGIKTAEWEDKTQNEINEK